jgi:hypothetical protein
MWFYLVFSKLALFFKLPLKILIAKYYRKMNSFVSVIHVIPRLGKPSIAKIVGCARFLLHDSFPISLESCRPHQGLEHFH